MSEIVYLDICCFKRPFDDAAVERVRREAEAVAAILDAADAGRCQLVRSVAHDFENDRNPREDRRLATRLGSKSDRCHACERHGGRARSRARKKARFHTDP